MLEALHTTAIFVISCRCQNGGSSGQAGGGSAAAGKGRLVTKNRSRMSLRSIKIIDRRCEMSSALPSQFRACLVISPPATMKACIDQDAFAELGIEYLVAEHHQRLVGDLGDVGVAGVAGAGSVQLALLRLEPDVEHVLGRQRERAATSSQRALTSAQASISDDPVDAGMGREAAIPGQVRRLTVPVGIGVSSGSGRPAMSHLPIDSTASSAYPQRDRFWLAGH
jgi:hypothetical protein